MQTLNLLIQHLRIALFGAEQESVGSSLKYSFRNPPTQREAQHLTYQSRSDLLHKSTNNNFKRHMAQLCSRSPGNTRDHTHTHTHTSQITRRTYTTFFYVNIHPHLCSTPPPLEKSLNSFNTFNGNVFSLSPEGIFTQRGGCCPLQESAGLSSHHYQHFRNFSLQRRITWLRHTAPSRSAHVSRKGKISRTAG